MKINLKAKIFPKYLDDILSGIKKCEYREIESIELTDGKRTFIFDVVGLEIPTDEERKGIELCQGRDVKWTGKPMLVIELGKIQVMKNG